VVQYCSAAYTFAEELSAETYDPKKPPVLRPAAEGPELRTTETTTTTDLKKAG